MPATTTPTTKALLLDVVSRHWGFTSLRPMQEQAMHAVMERRDSLVVLPTGGGKSLCYQAPAVALGGTTVVISPLIALMKDQVDSLRENGVVAAQLDSSLSSADRAATEADLRNGKIRLLFLSPERLVQTELHRTLAKVGVQTIAVDEAHCISHWGHDFRPEYRMLRKLREHLPDASMHAYTATATAQVRQDIIAQLGLNDPTVLVGDFDRPNLIYRVWPRQDMFKQVQEVIGRHVGEAGIIYCMRRKDVESLTAKLRDSGINARAYHAGLAPEERQATQEEFVNEKCDIVVATVAFGMGIDRSNVRFVLHIAMPKSIEHYQQEAGRAGRDGIEAECVLLYSGGDAITMKAMMRKSAEEAGDTGHLTLSNKHVEDMDRFARGAVCRHKALVAYFGQEYTKESCKACDLCLGDSEEVPEATVVAQKILSCVARVKGRFGLGHVLGILRGKNIDNIRKYKHEELSTFGLLKDYTDNDIRDWIYQLIGHGVLDQTDDEYPKLQLNESSWEVMRGQREVRLVQLVRGKGVQKKVTADAASWDGVDQELFERLRVLRRELASERQVPPYVIFSDATLRELARIRPSTLPAMRAVYGVGEAKLRDLGDRFLAVIQEHCAENGLHTDSKTPPPKREQTTMRAPTARQTEMFGHFRKNKTVDQVVLDSGLARSTVMEYLAGYVRQENPASLLAWVTKEEYARVADAARQVGADRLKPVFLALGEKVPYDTIRLVLAHLHAKGE